MQKSCLIIGLAETGNAVTAYFSRSCLHGAQNFSFPILNDFDSRRRQSYSRDYCSCFSTCNGVRWSECSGSFISGQDACSVKSKYLISVFASFAYVRNIIIVNVVDNGKIRCCFRENNMRNMLLSSQYSTIADILKHLGERTLYQELR